MLYKEVNDTIAFHPAYYINMMLEGKDIDLHCLNLSEKNLKNLLKGEYDVDKELAQKLGEIFQTSTAFWINLQQRYNILLNK